MPTTNNEIPHQLTNHKNLNTYNKTVTDMLALQYHQNEHKLNNKQTRQEQKMVGMEWNENKMK